VPPSTESFDYDADGNLTADGRWTAYVWDGENRLIEMRRDTGTPTGARQRLTFEYDPLGRRTRKTYFTHNGTNWVEQRDTTYLHDGWNLVGELDANNANATLRTYVWGTDLSGTKTGAGGVGGLLWVNNAQSTGGMPTGIQFVAYDGNGNVAGLFAASDGSNTARYEYGPFGEPLRSTGPLAAANPVRWSTKVTDDETGLVYYGYRYYCSATGRWPNRDPINELGFKLLTRSRGAFNSGEEKNLYAFVGNNPVSRFDPDGQKKKGPIAILIGLLTGCGKGPKAPNLPTLDANCAADPQVKQDYQRLIDCNSADGDGNAECAIICDCLAQGGGPAVNVCYNNCRNAYAKRCP